MTLFVQPIRFTDNIDEMARLLATLGLSVSITSDKGGWVELSGRTGTVALHSAADSATGAQRGQTLLSFAETDLEALARKLVARGFGNDDHPEESMVYDEAYGQAITITRGTDQLTINGRSDDLYGYSSTGTEPGVGDLRVVPIRFVDDPVPDQRMLEALGFSLDGDTDERFTKLALPGTGGAVGLHPTGGETPVISGSFAVQLHFGTGAPLPDIIRRAESAGAAATLYESEFGAHVAISDPDGQQIQVHPATV